MNLAKYSLDNTKIVYFFLAVLLIGGVFSFGRLGKKEDAPFVIKTAVIMTRYPGAEPAEVERLITEPISREIQSMSGVYKIKSESMYGLSKITFELQPSLSAASIPQKWDELRRKVLNIQPQLPAGASAPTVSDDFGDVFGIYYGLVGDDGFSYEEMRNWAERIKTQVITADGVMKVALFGTQTEVINIFISVNKLAGMGIDPKQLASLLQSQNQIINTGEISAGEQQLRVVANGTYTTVNDIRSQIITTPGGQVKLGDIAIVEKGYMDPPGTIMHVNGKRAIGIGISTDPQKDVVKTGELVDKRLAELLPLIPVGLELESLYPENVIAKEANNGFIINLIDRNRHHHAGNGSARRRINRFFTDIFHWRHTAHHVVSGRRTEPHFPCRFHHSYGHAGGQRHCGDRQCTNRHSTRCEQAKSTDRRCHRAAVGIAGSNFHSHLFFPSALSCTVFRSRNRKAVIHCIGYLTGIKLGTGIDANHDIRQFHTESPSRQQR